MKIRNSLALIFGMALMVPVFSGPSQAAPCVLEVVCIKGMGTEEAAQLNGLGGLALAVPKSKASLEKSEFTRPSSYQDRLASSLSSSEDMEAEGVDTPVVDDAVKECLIKGQSDSRIYHVPGSEYYDRTNVDLAYGDKWFCSVEEAEKAFYRPPS